MSSIGKSIGKIFKKVAKVVKKVAPYVLLAAAVVFTAGVAITAIGGAGAATGIFSWATTVQGAIGAAFASSPTVAGMVSGAVTSGIVGAAVGGVTAAIKGGDIKKGMLTGGIAGFITGGIAGALSPSSFGINPLPAGGAETASLGTQKLGVAAGQEATQTGLTVDAAAKTQPLTPPPVPAPPVPAPAVPASAPPPVPGGYIPGSTGTFVDASGNIWTVDASGVVTAAAPAEYGVVGETAGSVSQTGKSGLTAVADGSNINITWGDRVAAAEVPWEQLDNLGKAKRVWDSTVNTKLGSAAVVGLGKTFLEDDDDRATAARIDAEQDERKQQRRAEGYSGTTGAGLLGSGSTTTSTVANINAPLAAGRWQWNGDTRRIEYHAATATA